MSGQLFGLLAVTSAIVGVALPLAVATLVFEARARLRRRWPR